MHFKCAQIFLFEGRPETDIHHTPIFIGRTLDANIHGIDSIFRNDLSLFSRFDVRCGIPNRSAAFIPVYYGTSQLLWSTQKLSCQNNITLILELPAYNCAADGYMLNFMSFNNMHIKA